MDKPDRRCKIIPQVGVELCCHLTPPSAASDTLLGDDDRLTGVKQRKQRLDAERIELRWNNDLRADLVIDKKLLCSSYTAICYATGCNNRAITAVEASGEYMRNLLFGVEKTILEEFINNP